MNIDCASGSSRANYCSQAYKQCPNQCSGYGTCVAFDRLGQVIPRGPDVLSKESACRTDDLSCTTQCQCQLGYFGSDCSLISPALDASRLLRTHMCLYFVFFITKLCHPQDPKLCLEASSNRPMKLMAIVPEAKIGLTFVKIDRTAATHMVKDIYKAIYGDSAEYDSNMNEDGHWATLFNLQKVRRLRGNARFGSSLSTDGIAACVQFKVLKPTSERPVKKSVLAAMRANAQPRDITSPGLYMEKDRLTGNPAHLVAIDPGIKSIITAVRLDDPTLKPLKVTQAEYREASKLNYTMKKVGSHTNDFRKWMGEVMEILTNAPSRKSVLQYSEYLTSLGRVWHRSWAYHVRPKLRRIKFYAWRRREAWMTKLVSRMKNYCGEGSPVLFGDGANSGLFGRVRGAGVKGPVLEIKKRLSEQMPVIECSEFRTSKLCLDCGREAKDYRYGVTYCSQRDHHRMANRDVAAAKKIGARYLAEKKGLNLGPWSRGVLAEAVKEGAHASTVLRDVLTSYESGTFTF